MKLVLVVFVAALVGLGLGVGLVAWEVGTSPMTPQNLGLVVGTAVGPHAKVAINSVIAEVGQMGLSSKQRRSFTIRNEGEAVLKLGLGKTSCLCTVSELTAHEVPPGGTSVVTLEWKAEKEGPFRNTAIILTNDPTRPRLGLSVLGTAVAAVTIEPKEVVLGRFSASITKQAEVRIFSYSDESLMIASHEWTDSRTAHHFDLAITLLPAAEAQSVGATNGLLLTLTIKPGLPAGAIQQRIRLRTNLPKENYLEIPIDGMVTIP